MAEAQDLYFWDKTDAPFYAAPGDGEVITLANLIVEILTADGTTVLKTLSAGSGVTVDGILGIQVKFATDDPALGPGAYLYKIRDTTAGDRDVVTVGSLFIRSR